MDVPRTSDVPVVSVEPSVAPVAERFVVEALVIVAFVAVSDVRNPFVAKKPVALRFVVEAFVVKVEPNEAPVADTDVVEATPSVVFPTTSSVPVKSPFPPVKPVAERFVVLAFVAVSPVRKPFVAKKPEADKLVVEAFVVNVEVNDAPVALRFVVEAFPIYAVPEV